MRKFDYPVKLVKQKEGGYVVRFRDLPEAITQGDSIKDALLQADDCLEEAIANRIILKLDIPEPTLAKRGEKMVSLSATLTAKAALYLTIREQRLTNVALAKKLDCGEKEIRRMVDPNHFSKLPKIEHLLQLLGQRLHISLASV